MTPHENEWEIKSLQTRYKATTGIELNEEQAEKIFLFEQEKDSGSYKYSFSLWEEMDYEQDNFHKILTPLQFQDYISGRAIQLKRMEENLIENDRQYLPQLNAAEERLVYYTDILIPALRENLMLFHPTFNFEKEKVNFLKSEYKKYLIDRKKQTLVEHYRHCKTFQPTILKLSRLSHEQVCLYPDYFAFKATMDNATKSVADHMHEILSRISESLHDALKEAMINLKEFNTANTAKHIGEVRGWHVPSPINDKTEELMFAILFDPKKYIC